MVLEVVVGQGGSHGQGVPPDTGSDVGDTERKSIPSPLVYQAWHDVGFSLLLSWHQIRHGQKNKLFRNLNVENQAAKYNSTETLNVWCPLHCYPAVTSNTRGCLIITFEAVQFQLSSCLLNASERGIPDNQNNNPTVSPRIIK